MMLEEGIVKNYFRSRPDTRKYVFSNRIVDKWNNLPNRCMDCTTLHEFK